VAPSRIATKVTPLVAINPDDRRGQSLLLRARRRLARVLHELGRHDQAIATYNEALANVATYSRRSGDMSFAERLAEIAEDGPGTLKSIGFYVGQLTYIFTTCSERACTQTIVPNLLRSAARPRHCRRFGSSRNHPRWHRPTFMAAQNQFDVTAFRCLSGTGEASRDRSDAGGLASRAGNLAR
jgi:hypothetical protein